MKNSFLNKKGFSLSENIIVISILGLIIAAVVPGIIHKRELRNDRIAVRKAVTLYQGIMEKGLIEHTGLRTGAILNNEIFNANNNCLNADGSSTISPIFDTTSVNNCYFTTRDGIRWYIASDYVLIELRGGNTLELNAANLNTVNGFANNDDNLKAFHITAQINNERIELFNNILNTNPVKTRNFIMND